MHNGPTTVWWDQVYGGDMDRAKKALAGPQTGVELSNITGLGKGILSQYRTGKRDIEQAGWSTVSKLARAWDAKFISEKLGTAEAMQRLIEIDKKLDLLGDDAVAAAIREIVMTDPLAVIYAIGKINK